jgi:predicted DNA-binding transcriptional regulator YafY
VECRYYTIGRDADAARTLEAHGLFFNGGHWYCVASDAGQDTPKVFRLDRISGARLARGKHAKHDGPSAGFRLAHYLGRSAWDLSDAPPTRAVVRFRFPEARWVVAQGVGQVREPFTEDGGAVIEFAVRDPEPFLRWLLTFRDHAEVEDPAGLADDLANLRRRVAELYAADV